MEIFTIKQSPASYFADFAVYGAVIVLLALAIGLYAPERQLLTLALWVPVGVALWTLMEYLLHRFVLHHLPPFAAMHAMHHRNPRAYVSTPTVVTIVLFAVLVFMPMLWLASVWVASAVTLGVLLGYVGYGLMHHAVHHWRGMGTWFAARKRCHALHHHSEKPVYYGVTTSVWDHVFGTAKASQ